mgnify:FL=1
MKLNLKSWIIIGSILIVSVLILYRFMSSYDTKLKERNRSLFEQIKSLKVERDSLLKDRKELKIKYDSIEIIVNKKKSEINEVNQKLIKIEKNLKASKDQVQILNRKKKSIQVQIDNSKNGPFKSGDNLLNSLREKLN